MENQRELCVGTPREGGAVPGPSPQPHLVRAQAETGKRPGCSSSLPEGLSGPQAGLGRPRAGGLGSELAESGRPRAASSRPDRQ